MTALTDTGTRGFGYKGAMHEMVRRQSQTAALPPQAARWAKSYVSFDRRWEALTATWDGDAAARLQ